MFWDVVLIVSLSLIPASFFAYIIAECTDAEGLEFVNPVWLYKRFRVNWFGASFLALLFSLLTIPCVIGYWFYKICTVGRNDWEPQG